MPLHYHQSYHNAGSAGTSVMKYNSEVIKKLKDCLGEESLMSKKIRYVISIQVSHNKCNLHIQPQLS